MLKTILLLVVVAACSGCRRKVSSVSCPGIGTFSKTGPYALWPLPKCPSALAVKMLLYTRNNRYSGKLITANTIPSLFRSGKRTVFFAHGYLHLMSWFAPMKKAFLIKGDFNIITVDWDSKKVNYAQSASDTRTAGAEVARVARNLVNSHRITRKQLWCMGQSLGAHVCGNAGKKYRFGRVTGLDPAGPLFRRNTAAGLTRLSGDFVDVIHTDAKVFGMMTPVGHVDFYPNAAKIQPGCIIWPVRHLCSHRRSYNIFMDTVSGKSKCYTSMKCSSHRNIPGGCNGSTNQRLGYYSESYSGRGLYYLKTRGKSAYC